MHQRLSTPFALLAVALLLGGAAAGLAARPLAAQTAGARPPVRPFNPPGQSLLRFDATLGLHADGRLVVAAGPLGCEAGEVGEIHIVLTQEATAAMTTGSWTGICTGGPDQRWEAPAGAVDEPRFAPGEARGCAVAVFRRDGFPTAAGQWCDTVGLVIAP